LKYLVTGGAGFIGSNIAGTLQDQGDVLIVDDLSTGKYRNIEPLVNDGARFYESSILDTEKLLAITKEVDYIFHQAALPSVARSIKDPIKTNNVNVSGTLNVLEAARTNHVKKVIYASSSSVYGESKTLPKKESMTPNPISPYAVSKLTSEYYCRTYSKIFGLPTVCLRYFNVYGQKQNPQSEYSAVIPKFITRILQGKQPTINGDGNHTRDFTYIKDVVQANIKAMKPKTEGIFNVAYGEKTSLNELVNKIMELTSIYVNVKYGPERPGDIKDSLADISKARKQLGYRPKYDINRGLKETIKWYKNY
jgi:UDP-glucose 4-epimerase